jgi:hypothetical protein
MTSRGTDVELAAPPSIYTSFERALELGRPRDESFDGIVREYIENHM